MAKRINDLLAAASVQDTMQFETDLTGTTSNKVTATQIKSYAVSDVEIDITALQDDVDLIEGQLGTNINDISSLQSSVTTLQNSINGLVTLITNLENEIDALVIRVNNIESTLDDVLEVN